MNYKQSILNNSSSIRKQNLKSISISEASKDVSKYYKTIHFSLFGGEVRSTPQNKKKTSHIQPLRVIVLKFNTPEKCEKPYTIDVSCFFNKPSKSVILRHSKKIKISRQFAHWIKPYGVLKKQSLEHLEQGFNNINAIVGSDISMHEYELYIDLKYQNLALTKSHISYIVAQTLCKTRYINKSYQVSYTEHAGVIGAFILKNSRFRNNVNPITIGYFISDYELKQCALTNFTKKQIIEVTQRYSAISPDRAMQKFEHLLGDTSASGQIRSSVRAESGGMLASNLQTIISISTLNSLKSPLYKLVSLLTKTQHLL
uniref:Uncharacterized protein n=1 Tax=Ulva sp. TM637 TaxID=2496872 RepID=A0A7R6SCL8_9CHLO|nr:hypothetical protein JXX86_mgp33 [Ulva sp. TM637]AZP40082.1 hypothetical protein [Ulva sp. TM637]